MNRFLEMEGYMPLVHFDNMTGKGAAGCVDINDPQAEAYEITVNSSSMLNNASALRILAHEICHKFLAIRHMQRGGILQNLDEAMTELCAIYMGLGLIILNGYTENVGYLNLEDFCQPHELYSHAIVEKCEFFTFFCDKV